MKLIASHKQEQNVAAVDPWTTRPETLPNAVIDLVAFFIGYDLGRRWNATR